MVAITRPVNELSQNLSFMMESLYKVSVALQRQEYGWATTQRPSAHHFHTKACLDNNNNIRASIT